MRRAVVHCFLTGVMLFITAAYGYTQDFQGMRDRMISAFEADNYSEALDWAQRAMKKGKAVFGASDSRVGNLYLDFATIYSSEENWSQAISSQQQGLVLLERLATMGDDETAEEYGELAYWQFQSEEWQASLSNYERSIGLWLSIGGRDSKLEAARLMLWKAEAHRLNEEYTMAMKESERGVKLYKDLLGSESWKYGNALIKLAIVRLDMGDYTQAEPIFAEGVEVLKKLKEPAGKSLTSGLQRQAYNFEAQNKFKEAIATYREFVDLTEQEGAKSLKSLIFAKYDLGRMYLQYGADRSAYLEFKESLDLYASAEAEQRPSRLTYLLTRQNCAFAARSLGLDDEVRMGFQSILEETTEEQELYPTIRAVAKLYLAELEYAEGNVEACEALLKEVQPELPAALEEASQHWSVNDLLFAMVQLERKELKLAQARYQSGLARLDEEDQKDDWLEAELAIVGSAIEVEMYRSVTEESEALYLRAVEIYKRIYGEDDPQTRKVIANASRIQAAREWNELPFWGKIIKLFKGSGE